MLITPHLIFVHIPKTAGRFCRKYIVEYAGPVLYRGGLHEPASRIPEGFRHLPLVAFIRNPWDWYVSWYFHMHSYGAFNPLFACAVRSGKTEFEPLMNHVFDSIGQDTQAARILDMYMQSAEHAAVESHDLDVLMVEQQRRERFGMLSWRFSFNLEQKWGMPIHIGRYEDLSRNLIGCMQDCGVELEEAQQDAILRSGAVGEGKVRAKRDYRDFYTSDKLIERVAEIEQPIIDRFGYQFD